MLIPDPDLIERFSLAAAAKLSELDIALLVAEVIEPGLEPTSVRRDFDLYVADLTHQDINEPQVLLDWCIQQGYGVTTQIHEQLNLSHVRWVMQHRQGLPITLAVVLIELGRRVGLETYGVNFPGHFIVNIAGNLVDPATMQVVDAAQFGEHKLKASASNSLMQPATPLMLGLRMLNNVKAYYLHHQNMADALNVLDFQLAMSRQDAMLVSTLHFERGEIWGRLGAYTAAKGAFAACVDAAPTSAIADKARRQLARSDWPDEILH